MADKVASIDWYADGFEVRLEGGIPLGLLPPLAGFFSVAGTAATLMMLPAGNVEGWAYGLTLGVGAALLFGSGVVGAVARERRPVRIVEVDGHRLRVRRGVDDVELDLLLEEITGVDLDHGWLEIGHPGGVHRVDGSAQINESMQPVIQAIRAAVASRRRPETHADKARREQALAALARLRTQA